MNEETTLIAFKAITNFVKDLNDFFGKKNKSLQLYNRLLQHTNISHDKAISKHISLFQHFCKENISCIQERKTPLLMGTITYSDKVFIDMNYIFAKAALDEYEPIWKHLLTIDAILNPASHSKQLLLKQHETKSAVDSDDFIKSMMDKVQNAGAESPADLFSSGAMTEIMGGVQQQMASGNLDVGKLMGSVKTMMGSLAAEAGDDPQINQLMGMVNGLMNMAPAMMAANAGAIPPPSSLDASVPALPQPPGMDMSMISQLFGSMMSGMQNNNPPSQ